MSGKIVRETKVGNMIVQKREQLGLTQYEVGKKLGYKHGNYIGMLEKGQSYFPVEKWEAYANALGLDKKTFLRAVIEEAYPSMLPYFKE